MRLQVQLLQGFFSWMTGERSSSLPPLESPLEGVSLPPPLPDYVQPSQIKYKTLPSGVKIASEASSNPAASIGLYLNCGCVYETPMSCGATRLLERMAFKSTINRSHLCIVREVEAIGVAEGESRACRTCDNPQGLLLEAIHCAGYSGALTNSLLSPDPALNRLGGTILEEFVAENYTAPRMALAASGIDLEELLRIAEPLFAEAEPKSVYIGGDYRQQADSGNTHVVLAFEVPGGWHKEKEAIILTVLQMLMGGGGSFSAGGPGKGMHSQLCLCVLNEYYQIQSFSAINSIFNNTGLFGIYAVTGDPLPFKANKLSSTKTQLPYDYCYLKYCKAPKIVNNAENLGEVLRGDRIENSIYMVTLFL